MRLDHQLMSKGGQQYSQVFFFQAALVALVVISLQELSDSNSERGQQK